ncbi:MAG TPA: hypothetical protein PKK96_15315 [Anaerolineales bacterium]|nr:hypothetical protein [Anaerolineales bacterium]HNQ95785.1 hypothetical protein [Anaerolineales bacterium]HNS62371.1 hypothetical protein [Anaerolineales bacterium]
MKIDLRKSVLLALFLVACQPTNMNQVSPKITPVFPSVPTEASIMTSTTEVKPTIASTPVDQNPRVIELPRWVNSSFPGGILALPYGDGIPDKPSRLVFVNPDDGENFIIELQKEFYFYSWRDSENIVFLHEGDCAGSPKYISELNIFSGALRIYENKGDLPKNILNCHLDLEYGTVRLNNGYEESALEYIDPLIREVSLLTDPNDGITDISIELSQYDRFVAVVQFAGEIEMPETRKPFYGNRVSLFDLRTRRLVLQFSEEQSILPEVSFIDEVTLAYMRENTPCLILILSQVKKCVHNIPNRFPDSTIILSQNSYQDAGNLRFLYFSQQKGGYCSYGLIDGGLGCLDDHFAVLRDQFIINYSLSYYGHYVLIEYDSKGCPVGWCDFPEDTKLALIDFNEGELFELGSSNSYYLSEKFRPFQPDPWLPWH